MNSLKGMEIPRSEVTPPEVYYNRRQFMRYGAAAASVLATGLAYRTFNRVPVKALVTPGLTGLVQTGERPPGIGPNDLLTPEIDIVNYNNFYEFTTDKQGVAEAAAGFKTEGWQLAAGGLVERPTVFSLDEFRSLSPPEERIYRMRCVEAWSMVIPWAGFSLSKLLKAVQPKAEAKYVAFETLHDPVRMPGQRSDVLDWPYVEGRRLDEAMHPMTLLATGLYGRELPPQDGAPIRLVIPWKYGFKGIKSIVKITLTDKEPPTSWGRFSAAEYGFFANVNPAVDHPRWSQATEQRIGVFGRRKTLPFNGYADEVAHLYAGMDLRVHH